VTVAATSSFELTIDQIVLAAYRQAGLLHYSQGLDQSRGSYGRTNLATIIDLLQAEGTQVRCVTFTDLVLEEGTAQYSFGQEVIDVIGDGSLISSSDDPDKPASATPIMQMDRARWQALASKAAESSRPVQYYAERFGLVTQAWLWPTPTDTNSIARFMTQVHYPDVNNGSNTVKLERQWAQYLIWQLAYELSLSQGKSADKRQELRAGAQYRLQLCKGFSNQHTGAQMMLDHPTGWGNY
jgi:hypothetical protein